SRIFGSLALVNRGGIGRHQRVQLAKSERNGAAVKTGSQFTGVRVDIVDVPDIAVVDFLVVVIFDLHDLVAGCEGPAEALDLAFVGRVQGPLQLDGARGSADGAEVHGAEHLDVTNGIEPEARRDARFDEFNGSQHRRLRIVGWDKVEVAVPLGPGQIGNK